ncbi:unnamed protein product, partial [Gadus morhua 'NCC']
MKVKLALTKLEEIKKESQILQAHESAIADNKKFDYEMAVDSGKTVVLAALGRPFSLGMLYDCRNDSLIP